MGKPKKFQHTINILESLREVGGSASKNVKKSVKKESKTTLKALNDQLIKKAPKDAINQIFGPRIETPNESKESALKKEISKRKSAERKLSLERKLHEEEKHLREEKTNELRIELHAIMQEVTTISAQTEELALEVKIASMQAPVEPGIYHLFFFTNLLENLISFRKKIQNASTWLSSVNGRSQRKNYWSLYKQHGAKFLLSGEHYLTRSAG